MKPLTWKQGADALFHSNNSKLGTPAVKLRLERIALPPVGARVWAADYPDGWRGLFPSSSPKVPPRSPSVNKRKGVVVSTKGTTVGVRLRDTGKVHYYPTPYVSHRQITIGTNTATIGAQLSNDVFVTPATVHKVLAACRRVADILEGREKVGTARVHHSFGTGDIVRVKDEQLPGIVLEHHYVLFAYGREVRFTGKDELKVTAVVAARDILDRHDPDIEPIDMGYAFIIKPRGVEIGCQHVDIDDIAELAAALPNK